MIGESRAFCEMVALLEKIAAYDATVLIEGETGTGKELAARAIHYGSSRRHKPFLPINCGALQDTLIENELFGHCRGAFTDARTDQPGLIEAAHGGTLFLDEIDSLSFKGQVTLLRFLEDRHYRPLGGRSIRTADARVIAASNVSLEDLTRDGRFRADLLYRLKIMRLRVPALRERQGDAALLATHFVQLSSKRFSKPVQEFAPETLRWFDQYEWPGNVRELENLVCQAFLLSDGPSIHVHPVGTCPETASALNYRSAKLDAIAEFERRFLSRAMKLAHGNVSEAARMIGTERRHLGRLLKKHRIDRFAWPA